jgi:hypothetical protein
MFVGNGFTSSPNPFRMSFYIQWRSSWERSGRKGLTTAELGSANTWVIWEVVKRHAVLDRNNGSAPLVMIYITSVRRTERKKYHCVNTPLFTTAGAGYILS